MNQLGEQIAGNSTVEIRYVVVVNGKPVANLETEALAIQARDHLWAVDMDQVLDGIFSTF